MSGPLDAVHRWPARATAAWLTVSTDDRVGPATERFAWASVTKIVTALAAWIAVEEGIVDRDDPAGPPGSTLAHLLGHASGRSPDSDAVLAPPGKRRIYSNYGIEEAALHIATRAEMPFSEYARAAVIDPLGMDDTDMSGSPASGATGPLEDLLRLGRELLQPTLISSETRRRATRVAFPGLVGVLPGFGRQDPNDWGLGVEIRDQKSPHWTGRLNSPETFGHFGQSGGFLWVDPSRGVVLASLSDRPFGPWAGEAWPELADAVLGPIGS
jgi:CubicO group peptidase (beta-lactamase class C family)